MPGSLSMTVDPEECIVQRRRRDRVDFSVPFHAWRPVGGIEFGLVDTMCIDALLLADLTSKSQSFLQLLDPNNPPDIVARLRDRER